MIDRQIGGLFCYLISRVMGTDSLDTGIDGRKNTCEIALFALQMYIAHAILMSR